MTLIFSSGGGRLGNQLLNIIHLSAISYEYDIDVYKIGDLFIKGKNRDLIFNIEKKIVNWIIVSQNSKNKMKDKLFLKIFIRIIHFYYFISPQKRSYKIGLKDNLPKYIIGKSMNKHYSIIDLIQEGKIKNIVLSGWGLRQWDLVLKHKESIKENMSKGFVSILNSNREIKDDYIFVHIRRSDFLNVYEFQDLNYDDEIWMNSIFKICATESIKKVVIFSDSIVSNYVTSFLKNNQINFYVIDEGSKKNINFLELFVNYLYHSKAVVCNASSLVLSLSFLFHETIYLPSKNNDFKKISLNKAHKTYPSSLNWN